MVEKSFRFALITNQMVYPRKPREVSSTKGEECVLFVRKSEWGDYAVKMAYNRGRLNKMRTASEEQRLEQAHSPAILWGTFTSAS